MTFAADQTPIATAAASERMAKRVHAGFRLLANDNLDGLDADRLACLRRFEDGTGYAEIAEEAGIAVGTVKSGIYRLRAEILRRRAAAAAGGAA